MLKLRPAGPNDKETILRILNEADLRYKKEAFDNFYLAESNGDPAGIVRLEEHDRFIFLTSLGAANAFLKQGIGRSIMEQAVALAKKDIYIYTIIPEFFSKFGFKPSPAPNILPSREIFGCDECFPGQCLCMVKKYGA